MKARAPAILLAGLLLSGCGLMIERATSNFADDLESAIRQYDDPETVASALPAYLMLLEARLQSRPDDASLRLTAARLTATHAALFAQESKSASTRRLTERGLTHARTGACLSSELLCGLKSVEFNLLDERIDRFSRHDLDAVYVLATSWVSWIDTHSDEFKALADLPRAEALLHWVVEQDSGYDDGAAWLYLAVLHSQRPPAAGGQPDAARRYFERAQAESQGRNLLVNVLMADSYARLLFDRDLYVQLLEEVIDSEIEAEEFRLLNQVARTRAADMLEQTEEIFD